MNVVHEIEFKDNYIMKSVSVSRAWTRDVFTVIINCGSCKKSYIDQRSKYTYVHMRLMLAQFFTLYFQINFMHN